MSKPNILAALKERSSRAHKISLDSEIPDGAVPFIDPDYDDVEVFQLLGGDLEVTTSKVKPQVINYAEPFPFPVDEVVYVVDGECHTLYQGDDEPIVSKAGELSWLPKGAVMLKQEFFAGKSGHYMDIIVLPGGSVEVPPESGE